MKRSVFFLVCLSVLFEGCGSNSGPNPPTPPTPPPPPQNLISITAPADSSTLASVPVKVSVHFATGADPTTMHALLNGADVTALFGPADSSGNRTATVDRPAANLGKNQLKIVSGTQTASGSFWVSYGNSGAGTDLAASASLPLLIPIQTRIVQNDGSKPTDYGIALYENPADPTAKTMIWANPIASDINGADGFQIVMLKRSDLSVQMNTSVENYNYGSNFAYTPLFEVLQGSPPAGCGQVGCLVIVQSLQTIGYTPCSVDSTADCLAMRFLFEGIGGSGRVAFANGQNSQIAYSYIGNSNSSGATVKAGTWFERLTCSGSNYGGGAVCDQLGFPNTSYTAPAPANGASTSEALSQVGKISGALVRDNYNNFTYAQNARPVSFSTKTTNNGQTNTITVDGIDHVSGSLNGSQGGFHLLILNRNTLAVEQENTFPSSQDGSASQLNNVISAITSYQSYGNLFFLTAFGNTTYFPSGRALWYKMSNLIAQIGGTQQVFYLLNNPEVSPTEYDDYTLVGAYIDQQNTGIDAGASSNAEIGAEMSSVISRETEAYPLNSDMEGYLQMDHEGYYSPKSFGHAIGMSNVVDAEVASASLLAPASWPFPGADGTNNNPRAMAAYSWISQQLCCGDIRAAYVNLNIAPNIWLDQLQNLSFDSTKVPDSDAADFETMKEQLALEFQYVSLVRNFQTNLTGLYQDQQANLSLLLQQVQDEVTQNLQVDLNTPAPSARWSGIVQGIFGVLSSASSILSVDPEGGTEAAAGIQTALAAGSLAITVASDFTNSSAGTSLKAQEQLETTAGKMAGKAADEFSANLVSLGGEFDRVVSDWGRLKTLGAPLLADQIPWDGNAAGVLLEAYDRMVRREFYTQLIKTNSAVIYYPYNSDHSSIETSVWGGDHPKSCSYRTIGADPYWKLPSVPLLFYPSGAPNTAASNNIYIDNHGFSYPYDYQWAVWALVFNGNTDDVCPMSDTQPGTFGLFKPMDPGNPENLGAYRLWWYKRNDFDTNTSTDAQPCYDTAIDC